jgi:hypothetical protein
MNTKFVWILIVFTWQVGVEAAKNEPRKVISLTCLLFFKRRRSKFIIFFFYRPTPLFKSSGLKSMNMMKVF